MNYVEDTRYFNRTEPCLSHRDWFLIWAKLGEQRDFCYTMEPIEDET